MVALIEVAKASVKEEMVMILVEEGEDVMVVVEIEEIVQLASIGFSIRDCWRSLCY